MALSSGLTTIGVLGSGQAGSTFARAAISAGYDIVIANSRGPHTLRELVRSLGPKARAASAAEASASDVVFLAYPYSAEDHPPAAELADKVVIDNNNYMPWRDGRLAEVDAGLRTVHELRQAQIPRSKLVKAFSHVQFHARHELRAPNDVIPAIFRLARPAGHPERKALALSSNDPEARELVTKLYDDLGFDAVDNSPLSESWRSAPGTPMWRHIVDGRSRESLARDLVEARHPASR